MLKVISDKDIYIKKKIVSDFVNYYTIISSKNYDDKVINCNINIKFMKDVDMPHNSKIRILDAFIAFNPYSKLGYRYPYVFIKSYELVEIGKTPEEDGSAFEDFDDYSFV